MSNPILPQLTRPVPSRLERGEEGASLIMVIGIAFVLLMVVTSLMSSALQGFRGAVTDERYQAALAAADAGVEDYLYRLNQDGNHWRYDADDPPPGDPTALTEPRPVPGAANPATFTYAPDTSRLATRGTISLRSTGEVGGARRTVDVTLRRRSFLDYLYFTDLETQDPASYPPGTGVGEADWAQANCTQYAWATTPRDENCSEITFFAGSGFVDRIHGPLHTNDRMRIHGPVEFNGATSSSMPLPGDESATPTCPPERYLDVGGGDPVFANGCDPRYEPLLQLPPNNDQIAGEADHTLGRTGCLFTGPTIIEFRDNATMRVDSPFTQDGNCRGDTPNVDQPLPPNGVLYVQDVPSDPSDTNHVAGCPTHRHPFWDQLRNGSGTRGDFDCRDGDAFVWGTLDGQATVAASNDVNIVWHLEVADLDEEDVLGLVADNYVRLYHPTDWRGRNEPPRFHDDANSDLLRDPRVHAAILSVRHSFTVQDFRDGDPLGTLHLVGTIAQRYRGPVGTFNASSGTSTSGYEKDYRYDERLRYLAPPHFLDPVESAWRVSTWSEATPG